MFAIIKKSEIMKFKLFFLAAFMAAFTSCALSVGESRVVKTQIPKRPAGQEDVLLLRTPKMDSVRIGFIGLGMRGAAAVERFFHVPGASIKAVCDLFPEKVSASLEAIEKAGFPMAEGYSGEDGWKKLCERDDIDLVYVCTDWKPHASIGVYAMEHGKHVAIEVPAAMTLEEIWALVNTAEKTRKHCVQLENCVYDFFELATLALAQKGVFGEILHVEGSYHHSLADFWDSYAYNWRLDYNRNHKGDLYPTHGLGPVCQVLNIHRGDRLKTLVAMDTKSVNGKAFWKKHTGEEVEDFQAGDQTNTLISTEKGKTILIEHNVMTPRPYDRMYQLVGTQGYASKYPVEQYLVNPENINKEGTPDFENLSAHRPMSKEAMKVLQEKYPNPLLTPELKALAQKVGGHGGMDFIMDYRLVYCLINGLPMDMDVYDLAEWCGLIELSRISIENGNAPVEVPDFTRGAWNKLEGYSYFFAE